MHLFDERKAADAGADDDSEAVAVFGGRIELRVIDGDLRRGHGEVNECVGFLDLFLLDPLFGDESTHFAGDLAGIVRGIELRDAIDPRAALQQSLPCRLVADAEWRDHADAGDDDAAWVQREGSK